MEIQRLQDDQLTAVSKWLAQCNEQDVHYIAWLESEPSAIEAQIGALLQFNEPHAWVAVEEGRIIGFIGLEPFEGEQVGRLLGPFVYGVDALNVMETLWERALAEWKNLYSELKVAFFEQNQDVLHFCESKGFKLYNREKNLILLKQTYLFTPLSEHVVPYEGSFDKLQQLHPDAAYFNATEMTYLIQDPHFSLWCYKEEDTVKGYIFFEQIEGMDEGEICFLQVEDSEQGQGIGSALIRYACHQAFLEQDLSVVTVPVRSTNPQAEKLYKELGFQEHTTIVAYTKTIN
ncbi:GNAT family N-acetyltransferase [Pontibacillus sp. ALD_SL1]|uniref:GNAT family N-acetyltransferase n=1 Tax=Pontibacillus sp. ALD_SL1 TaxID=2777185 RepID=UPI001A96F8EB|nr:GNAT family N-acetyltransferase [Pontibacillus sp. ALD_SL1]QSS99900.1 GNAT family N-acetyltransferase [Pontibacillus sp. ALD_SL1]